MHPLISRLIADDAGQDLVEYALLSALISVVGVLIFREMTEQMRVAYDGWLLGVEAAWEPAAPGS